MTPARILLTGSRTWPDPRLLEDTLLDTWHDATQLGYDGILLTHGDADYGIVNPSPPPSEEPAVTDPHLIRKLNRIAPLQHRRPIPYQPAPDHTINRPYLEELAALPYDDYMHLVGKHLGVEHNNFWDYFLHPDIRHRTLSVLRRKHALVVRRLCEPHHQRTEKSLRGYLGMLNDRIEQTLTAIGNSAFQDQQKTINILVNAITKHRQELAANEVKPERWDYRLWSALDRVDLPEPPKESPKVGPRLPEDGVTKS